MDLYKLKEEFIKVYGQGDKIRFFHAPGRVNLIGEHTDYNGGYVFPAALSMGTTIAVRLREDNLVRMKATDLEEIVEIRTENLDSCKSLKWGNYQAGVISELKKRGYIICGCDLLYDDTLPHGGGLSSSAAIEIATALCFATLSNEKKQINTPVDMMEMAKIGQAAENNYVGVSCGIMDQFASAMGEKDHALLLKCDTLSYQKVGFLMDGYNLVIVNTNKKRSLIDSKYNERRAQCEKGLSLLQKEFPAAGCLSDISRKEFEEKGHVIDDEIIRRRVRHVISENERVLKSVRALENKDMHLFGKLLNQSHDSLRFDYEVTGTELDTLVDEARKIDGVLGSRMTGAGFGGCTVSLVKKEALGEFMEKVGSAYTAKIGYAPGFYVSEIEDGAHEIR